MAPVYHHGFHGNIISSPVYHHIFHCYYIVPWPQYTIIVFIVISYHGPTTPSWCSWLYLTMGPVYHHGFHGYIIPWPRYTIMVFIVTSYHVYRYTIIVFMVICYTLYIPWLYFNGFTIPKLVYHGVYTCTLYV